MIEFAKREHRSEMHTLWKTCFPMESSLTTNYFFSNIYDELNTLMITQNNRVIGGVNRVPVNILFNGRYIKSSVITSVMVDPRYRHQGLMHELMNVQLSHLSHTELITIALAKNNSDLSEFGFEPLYLRKTYEITRNQVPSMNNEGISFRFRANDMIQLYATYVKRFNGFVVRSKQDMENLVKRSQALGGKVIFYYDGNDVLQGYCAYHMDGLAVIVDELVYMDSIALIKMMNYALMERHYIVLSVSDKEDLSQIFPQAKVTPAIYAGFRINDFELFNRLYNCSISNGAQASLLSTKGMHCLLNF